jgi:hypothetical protein
MYSNVLVHIIAGNAYNHCGLVRQVQGIGAPVARWLSDENVLRKLYYVEGYIQ